jgi:hypothetical protein
MVCAELFSLGYAPFCPWHDKSFVMDRPDDEFTVEKFYRYSIAWLEVSDYWLSKEGFAVTLPLAESTVLSIIAENNAGIA